jgi:branched-chain amino acid transport system permease protein
MGDIIQVIVNGFMLGGVYSLVALGLTVCFGVLNVLNVAHGEFVMLGAFCAYIAYKLLGLNPFLSMVVISVVFFGVGYLFEKYFIEPISDRSFHEMLIAATLVTFGIALALEDITAFIWGGAEAGISYELPALSIGSLHISSLRLVSLVSIILLTVLFQIFLKKSYTGKALRAITLNRKGAMVVGINIKSISRVTSGVGISLAAIAGVIYATLYTVDPFIGLPLTVKVLAVIVLGGVGSFSGALVGGLLLGITECLVGQWFGLEWSPAVAFLLLIVILIFRPEGLFGRTQLAR